jgi:hypothetical protein
MSLDSILSVVSWELVGLIVCIVAITAVANRQWNKGPWGKGE